MTPSDILFVGGNVNRLASIKIRCREIASRLGCDTHYEARRAEDVPNGYKAYVCVKPDFPRNEIGILARKGIVIWDILDEIPPQEHVLSYIGSTQHVAQMFSRLGRVAVIPHYHCNIERVMSVADSSRIAYLGSEHWYPKLADIPHATYFADRWTREEVAAAYRQIGLAINYRHMGEIEARFLKDPRDARPDAQVHVRLNSGVKLINCLGFGIPSVSPPEPAYLEFGAGCTVVSLFEDFPKAVRDLSADREKYAALKARCLERAEEFHIDTIIRAYQKLLFSL
jgi:hypothetical protein